MVQKLTLEECQRSIEDPEGVRLRVLNQKEKFMNKSECVHGPIVGLEAWTAGGFDVDQGDGRGVGGEQERRRAGGRGA